MSMMNHRENRAEREYKLTVIGNPLGESISVQEEKIIVKNMIKPQMRDLMAAINELYPALEREQFSLYCRYNDAELYPILDHMTMVTAFALMDAHESPLLYLIRKDLGDWVNHHPKLMKNPSDVRLLVEAGYGQRWTTDYRRGRAEHIPDPEEGAARGSKKKRSSDTSQKSAKGGRKSVTRKSVSRKSMKRKSKTK